MNHQRFKFYKHSTSYYKSLYNTINDLDIINLQMLGLQVNGVNAIAQLELAV